MLQNETTEQQLYLIAAGKEDNHLTEGREEEGQCESFLSLQPTRHPEHGKNTHYINHRKQVEDVR